MLRLEFNWNALLRRGPGGLIRVVARTLVMTDVGRKAQKHRTRIRVSTYFTYFAIEAPYVVNTRILGPSGFS